jgi:hypothetical protein
MLMTNVPAETLVGGDGALLRAIPVNTLLIGPTAKVDALIAALLPQLESPVAHWWPTESQPLPRLTSGTLILHDVAAIPPERQAWFSARLGALGRPVRVISTSETRVWPLVQRGAFLASLYYRLNVLCLDLTRTPAGT